MADILTDTAEYDGIRELLGVNALELPDGVIEQPTFLPSVELAVETAVEDWSDLLATTAGAIRLKSAVMRLTAIALIPRARNRQRARESMGGIGGFTSGEINWDALKNELQRLADADLMALNATESSDEPVAIFTVGGVSRAECGRSAMLPSIVSYR